MTSVRGLNRATCSKSGSSAPVTRRTSSTSAAMPPAAFTADRVLLDRLAGTSRGRATVRASCPRTPSAAATARSGPTTGAVAARRAATSHARTASVAAGWPWSRSVNQTAPWSSRVRRVRSSSRCAMRADRSRSTCVQAAASTSSDSSSGPSSDSSRPGATSTASSASPRGRPGHRAHGGHPDRARRGQERGHRLGRHGVRGVEVVVADVLPAQPPVRLVETGRAPVVLADHADDHRAVRRAAAERPRPLVGDHVALELQPGLGERPSGPGRGELADRPAQREQDRGPDDAPDAHRQHHVERVPTRT